jgi:mRNA interferase HicA
VNRSDLLQMLRRYGCYRKREGKRHTLWCNPQTGRVEAIPRHREIDEELAKKILRNLSLPEKDPYDK